MDHTNNIRLFSAGFMTISMVLCSACSAPAGSTVQAEQMELTDMPADQYRTYYEIFPYSYADSNGDGVGDLKGIIKTLDYLNDGDPHTDKDLGYTGIWLTPIMPAVSYHKYDVTDYMNVDPQFGTMQDFDQLISESHARGINVIIDLVLNHTSSEHPWFKTAAEYLRNLGNQEPSSAECPYIDYYHFSKNNKDGYHLLSGTDWYYESRFTEDMPDLNLDSEAVWNEINQITSFWLSHHVDGFRLDAVKEYYTGSDEKNIEALRRLNTMVKEKKKDAYLVAEVWMNRDSYAKYYASGVDSVFDFAFANSDGNTASLVKGSITAQQYTKALMNEEAQYASYQSDYINAPFYTNHDTARSAGYYSGDSAEAMTKIAGALNFLQGGASFTYYGEELGMKGSGRDENKRAPMNWGTSEYQSMLCSGPQAMDPNMEMTYGTLAEQEKKQDSIYQYYKNAVRMRNLFPEIARGTTKVIAQNNDQIGVYIKESAEGKILVIFNASEEAQKVSSDVLKQELGSQQDLKKAAYLLLTSSDAVTYEQGELVLPPYSIVIYQS